MFDDSTEFHDFNNKKHLPNLGSTSAWIEILEMENPGRLLVRVDFTLLILLISLESERFHANGVQDCRINLNH